MKDNSEIFAIQFSIANEVLSRPKAYQRCAPDQELVESVTKDQEFVRGFSKTRILSVVFPRPRAYQRCDQDFIRGVIKTKNPMIGVIQTKQFIRGAAKTKAYQRCY